MSRLAFFLFFILFQSQTYYERIEIRPSLEQDAWQESDESSSYILQTDQETQKTGRLNQVDMRASSSEHAGFHIGELDLGSSLSDRSQRDMVMRVDIWNYSTNKWEGTIFYNLRQWHNILYDVIRSTNVSDYINDAGEVKAQVSYLRPAGVPPFWEISIDQVKWFIE